jgi:hypothetical protein
MEAKLSGSKITLPIGTEISLKMRSQNRMSSDVKLIIGDEDSKFFALFTENDVDFEIEINNRKCNHGIGYTLALNDGYFDYYLGPREIWTMETLYSNGQKLHFLSQNTDLGQQLVAETAHLHNISYGDAAAICCKIQFTFEVEKQPQKPLLEPQAMGLTAEFSEDRIDDLYSRGTLGPQPKSLSRKSPKLAENTLFKLSTQSSVNALAANSSAISNLQRDRACGTLGVDSVAMRQFDESAAEVPPLPPPPPPPEGPNMSFSSRMAAPFSSSEVPDSIMYNRISSLAKPFPTSATPAVPVLQEELQRFSQAGGGSDAPESGGEDVVGEKGVICFGDTSNQIYDAFGGFVKDKSLVIKPFVIEMRMSAKN